MNAITRAAVSKETAPKTTMSTDPECIDIRTSLSFENMTGQSTIALTPPQGVYAPLRPLAEERDRLYREASAHYTAGEESEAEEIDEREAGVEDKIIATPPLSAGDIAIQLRTLLRVLHTPEWREGGYNPPPWHITTLARCITNLEGMLVARPSAPNPTITAAEREILDIRARIRAMQEQGIKADEAFAPLDDRDSELEHVIAETPAMGLQDVAVKLRWLLRDMEMMEFREHGEPVYFEAVRTASEALERMAAPHVRPDPVVDAAACYHDAEAVFEETVTRKGDPSPEDDAAYGQALDRFVDTPVSTPAGALAKMEEVMRRMDEIGDETFVGKLLQDVHRWLAAVPASHDIDPDPMFAAIREFEEAQAAYNSSPTDSPDGDPTERRWQAAKKVLHDASPTTAAGMAAKIKTLRQFYGEVFPEEVDLLDAFSTLGRDAGSLGLGSQDRPALAPSPDMAALFARWVALDNEFCDLEMTADDADSRQQEISGITSPLRKQILEAHAWTIGDVVLKLRLFCRDHLGPSEHPYSAELAKYETEINERNVILALRDLEVLTGMTGPWHQPDPIHAAIAEFWRLWNKIEATPGDPKEADETRRDEVLYAIMTATPTTPEGKAARLEFYARLIDDEDFLGGGDFREAARRLSGALETDPTLPQVPASSLQDLGAKLQGFQAGRTLHQDAPEDGSQE